MKLNLTSSRLVKPKILFLAFNLIVFSTTIYAQQKYPSHSGSSPISFDDISEPNGEFVVSDRQSGVLDNYMYRNGSQYQISVSIPVSRYVGDVAEAVSKGTLSDKLKIYIPAYDVDAYTYPEFDCDGDNITEVLQPEVDEVYFNGHLMGTLDGDNNIWKFNDTFEVPIEWVNFPASPGDTAINKVEIKIDVDNAEIPLSGGGRGCQVWATSIDWIGLKFDAAQPIYLMTGLFGNPGALNTSGYVDNIENNVGVYAEVIEHGFASYGFCSANELNAISSHADEFINKIVESGKRLGTSEVHLIGHSMGGLDGRMVLKKLAEKEYPAQVGTMDGQPVYENVKVNSLTTHGSPHKGSLVADYLPYILNSTTLVEDLCELKVSTWDTANYALTHTNGAKFNLIGSDADWDQNGTLEADELSGNQIAWSGLGNHLYHILYDYDEIELSFIFAGGLLVPVPNFLGSGPNPNDTMVTTGSAIGAPYAAGRLILDGSDGKNHGTIIDTFTQDQAIQYGKGSLGWGEL